MPKQPGLELEQTEPRLDEAPLSPRFALALAGKSGERAVVLGATILSCPDYKNPSTGGPSDRPAHLIITRQSTFISVANRQNIVVLHLKSDGRLTSALSLR